MLEAEKIWPVTQNHISLRLMRDHDHSSRLNDMANYIIKWYLDIPSAFSASVNNAAQMDPTTAEGTFNGRLNPVMCSTQAAFSPL